MAVGACAGLAAMMWIATWGGPAGTRAVALLSEDGQASLGKLFRVTTGGMAASILIVLRSLVALAAVWLGAWGLGFPIRTWLLRGMPFASVVQAGTGLAALLMLDWLAAWAGLLGPTTAWGLVGVGIVLLAVQAAMWVRRARGTPAVRLPWLVLVPGVAVMLVAATCPPGTLWRVEAFGYDVLSHHLQIPRQWQDAGAMTPLTHNVYSYLPALVEAGYTHIGMMCGSVENAIYVCQLFHASLAMLAAFAIGCAVTRLTGVSAAGDRPESGVPGDQGDQRDRRISGVPGVLAASAFISVPWVVVTGSLAYSEMAVLAFGACSMVVLFDPRSSGWRGAAVIGFLLGAATLAKLTAGPMLALPVGVLLLMRLWGPVRDPEARRSVLEAIATAALAATLTVSPYLIRNAIWTGNPVFPFATGLLGSGHWDQALSDRWDRGHGPRWARQDRAAALADQWLFDSGYGAIGAGLAPARKTSANRVTVAGRVPVFWATVLCAAVLAVAHRGAMVRAVWAMGGMLALQVLFWLLATHMQSRFLIPTLLPASIVVGLGLERLYQLTGRIWQLQWLAPVAGGALVLVLVIASMRHFWQQTYALTIAGQRVPAPPWLAVDRLTTGHVLPSVTDHPINDLPPDTKTYLVADNMRLLYLRRPFVYHSAFDANPLGQMIRQARGDPCSVNAALQAAGFTHVWIGWSELDRLQQTYGFDPDVNVQTLRELINTGWTKVRSQQSVATLYALP